MVGDMNYEFSINISWLFWRLSYLLAALRKALSYLLAALRKALSYLLAAVRKALA